MPVLASRLLHTTSIISLAIVLGAALETAPSLAQEKFVGLEEIVVSAARREQSLQDVPIAVSAVSSEALERAQVSNVYELQTSVPSVVVNKYGNALVPFIRGVGSVDGSPGQEGAVSMYVDGVYYAAPFAANMDFNNIERIEVLKGPQGTLFGRNATGGAMQIITRDPAEELGIDASLSYGNYDTVGAKAYVTSGIVDNLAADLAVTFSHQGDGMGTNLANGDDVYWDRNLSLRSKWLLSLGERTQVRATFDWSRLKNSADGRAALPDSLSPTPGVPIVLLDGNTAPENWWDMNQALTPRSRVEAYGGALHINHSFDAFEFVSISAYRKADAETRFDQGGTVTEFLSAAIDKARFKTFTQELQVMSSPDSNIRWIAGLYYMDDTSGFDSPVGLNLVGPGAGGAIGIISPIESTSYAAYAEVTIPLVDSTRLTMGGRYTRDERKLTESRTLIFDPNGFDMEDPSTHNLLMTIPNPAVEATFKEPTWRVILDHDITDDIMGYVSVSRGFKSGNFNGVAATDPAFEPEILTAYEAGIKSNLLNNRLRLNIGGFYYRYSDMQLVFVVGATQRTTNAGKSEIGGAELSGDLVLDSNFTVSFSGSWLYSKFIEYQNGTCITPNIAGGGDITTCDHSGERTPKAPKFQFNISPTYTLPTEVGDFTVTASYYRTASYFWEANSRVKQPSYGVLNGRLGWNTTSGDLGVSIYGKNLTNAKYSDYSFGQALGFHYSAADKRTYGIELRVKY